jgi:archaellum component FlaC
MKRKILPWIIALSALSVSASAAFYSVSGLGKMFAGASLQVMILAGSLEFAKLVTASLLYEYWNKLNQVLKYYLLVSTIVLILITSAGIYGFLSSAYQETAFKVENQDKNVGMFDKRIKIIQGEISRFENQVTQKNNRAVQVTNIRTSLQQAQDQLISQSKATSSIRGQIKEIDSEIKRIDSEIQVLNDSISSKNYQITSLENQKLEASTDSDLAKEVGPLKYIADLTGRSLAEVVNWYILILMFVFDPLAIALVLASNFAFSRIKIQNSEEPQLQTPPLKDLREEESIVNDEMEITFETTLDPQIAIESPVQNHEEIKQDSEEESNENLDKYNEKVFGGYKAKPIPSQDSINPLSLR